MKNLFSFITLLILVHTTTELTEADPNPVLDIDGHALLRGEIYYVVPLSQPAQGAGIVPYAIPNKTYCSYGVSQLPYGEGIGIPLIFRSVNGSKLGDTIYDSTPLDISFSISVDCYQADVWNIGGHDGVLNKYFVMIGAGDPGMSGTFMIRTEPDEFYRFDFCYEGIVRGCRKVGIFYKDGVRRLAWTNDASDFHFRFRKYVPELEFATY